MIVMVKEFDKKLLERVVLPEKESHKGENGRVLVIGGSKLFHASIFWAADAASKMVDLVHFSSPAMENNELVRKKAKEGFWSGIVVPWESIAGYIEEDDSILIGPGMPREEGLQEGEVATARMVNNLLREHSQKRWVVDGGALQEVDPALLNDNVIVTPHEKEFERVFGAKPEDDLEKRVEQVKKMSEKFRGVTILLKGVVDVVCTGSECIVIRGGNEGMTKGGTGDVLAGLVVALYAKNEAYVAASAASYINKRAGDELYKRVGPFFSAGDLVEEIPIVANQVLLIF